MLTTCLKGRLGPAAGLILLFRRRYFKAGEKVGRICREIAEDLFTTPLLVVGSSSRSENWNNYISIETAGMKFFILLIFTCDLDVVIVFTSTSHLIFTFAEVIISIDETIEL